MSRASDAVEIHRLAILDLARLYGLGRVQLFGSVARGESDDQSDVDLLVDSGSLLKLGGFLMDVRDLLELKVDVITVNMLKPRVRERVLAEAKEL
jgi:predicted nucleotidyltransferase